MDHDPAQGSLNISDVIEVIRTTDPVYDDVASAGNMEESIKRAASVQIIEQPASKALRFRYECEGRSAGSIPGVNSTPENKTFPSIQIIGYKGPAVVVVSCVTKDPPYRPHPHNLVGKEGCKQGVCTMKIDNENMAVTFSNLGIQCVKKKDIEEALKLREQIRVDPFRSYTHRSQPTSIDLNAVRLCFQVFLEGSVGGKFTVQLTPVVSDPIFDKKAMSDLVICKLSHCSCSVAGGKEIILLCEKVAKEDIQVRFYEEQAGHIVWEANGDFQPTQVHKQVAISFRSPRYKTLEVEEPVKVNIQLRRPSDGVTSEPLPFEFQPLDSDRIKRKRQKYDEYGVDTRQFQELDKISRPGRERSTLNTSPDPNQSHHLVPVKREPVDPSPSGYHPYLGSNASPMFNTFRTMPPTPSPQAPSPSSAGRTPSPMDLAPWAPMETFYTAPNVPPFRLEHTQSGSNYHFMPNPFSQGTPQAPVNTNLGSDVGNLQRGLHGISSLNNLNVVGFGPSIGNVMSGLSNQMGLSPNIPTGTSTGNHQEQAMGETILVDLDNQYIPAMDSTEIVNLLLATGSLSESISCNLTLSDNRPVGGTSMENEPQENMTDSVRSIMRELHDLNNPNQTGSGCN